MIVRRRPRDTRPWLYGVAIALLFWNSTAGLVTLLGGSAVVLLIQAAFAFRRDRTPPADGVRLGSERDTGRSVVLTDRQLSAHGLIVGASGAGKSTTLLRILWDQVRRGRSVVAIDMKGSPAFAGRLADAAAEAARPFRLWTLDGPNCWNPLAHGNATELKDKLIATETFTEPHYQRAAERYVQTVMQVLEQVHPDRAPVLDEVVALMEPNRLARLLRDLDDPLAVRVQDYVASLGHDQLSAVRGLGTRLAIVSESQTGRFLRDAGPETIDLRRALAGPEVVLFSLNASTYGRLAAQIGTLAVQDLVTAAGHRLTEPGAQQAMIAIDEFSALESDNVLALLARGRESGVPVLLATQELADLDRAGRGFRDQVAGVTAVKIAHRQDVPSSARMIAAMAGTEEVWEHTAQTVRHPLFGPYDNGRGSRRLAERFVIDPNEIQSLGTGEAVVITKLPPAGARTVRVAPDRHAPRTRRRPPERAGPDRAGPER
jgi:conjugal transfer pilus assembly protein TraD